jgi:hypothetical protein
MTLKYHTDNGWIFLIILISWVVLIISVTVIAVHMNWRAALMGAAAMIMANAVTLNGKRLLG